MNEVKEKYNFKELNNRCNNILKENSLEDSKVKQLELIIYKIGNIDSIITNIDEEYVNFENEYEDCKKYMNYLESGQFTYLNSLADRIDVILNKIIKLIDFTMILNNKSKITSYVKNYKTKITLEKNKLEDEVKDIVNKIEEHETEIVDKKSKINTNIEELSNKLNSLDQNSKDIENKVSTMLEEKNAEVSDKISNQTKRLEADYEEFLIKSKAKFEDDYKQYKTNIELMYEELQKKDEKISELVGIVTEKGRIGEYKITADKSQLERIIWQVLTITLFFVSFTILVITTMITDYDKFTIIKYIVSAILMGAAAYTGRQAANCRKDEVYYRKQQLELASIDVYLENMSEDKKNEIKFKLSENLFGQAKNTYINKYDDNRNITTDEIIKLLEIIFNKKNN